MGVAGAGRARVCCAGASRGVGVGEVAAGAGGVGLVAAVGWAGFIKPTIGIGAMWGKQVLALMLGKR
jgi:hypothetical protein